MTLMAAGGAVAVFAAGEPGEIMSPTDGADLMVSLVQSQDSVLWVSLAGNVTTAAGVRGRVRKIAGT